MGTVAGFVEGLCQLTSKDLSVKAMARMTIHNVRVVVDAIRRVRSVSSIDHLAPISRPSLPKALRSQSRVELLDSFGGSFKPLLRSALGQYAALVQGPEQRVRFDSPHSGADREGELRT